MAKQKPLTLPLPAFLVHEGMSLERNVAAWYFIKTAFIAGRAFERSGLRVPINTVVFLVVHAEAVALLDALTTERRNPQINAFCIVLKQALVHLADTTTVTDGVDYTFVCLPAEQARELQITLLDGWGGDYPLIVGELLSHLSHELSEVDPKEVEFNRKKVLSWLKRGH
jgi:hypothetical protein